MFILGMLSWWYGAGWRGRAVRLGGKIAGIMDYFSIDLLLKTLFSPFRQISAGQVQGPLGVKLRAFFDRLISRIIGAFIRIFMVLIGAVTIIVYGAIGGLLLVVWAFVPVLPVVGIVLFVSGWIPWTL